MARLRGEVSAGIRLLAVAGALTTALSCGGTGTAGHPRHETASAVAPWRVVPGVRIDCRNAGSRTPSATTLLGVAATGPDDAWATGSCDPTTDGSDASVGPYGVVEHWDGAKWHRVPVPSDPGYDSVVALSKTDAWALGEHALIHWDGRRWTKKSRGLPVKGGYTSKLSATPAGNVFTMVTTAVTEEDVLVRWDKDRWRTVPPPHGCRFPADDAEAGDLAAGPGQDVWTDALLCPHVPGDAIWHYDGHQWKSLPPPPLGPHWNLDGITVIDHDTLVTVDDDDPGLVGAGHTKTYRWTAGAWRQLPDPSGYTRRGMAGDGHQGIWALGAVPEPYGDPLNRRIRHWDGHRWSDRALPAPPGGPADLRALAHVPGTATVWGVGTDAGHQPLIEVSGPL